MLASLRNEGVMHLDVLHLARPDQQRIRRIGGSLVAVPAALDDEAKVILSREIYRRRNFLSVSRCDCVHARLGSPRIDPSHSLRQARLVADVPRIFQVLPDTFGFGTG